MFNLTFVSLKNEGLKQKNMSISFRISYYLRSNYKNREGKTPLMARVYVGGGVFTVGTGINVQGDLWSAKTAHLKGRTVNALIGNLEIDKYTARLHAMYSQLSVENDFVTLEQFKARLSGKDKSKIETLLQAADKYNKNFELLVGKTCKKSSLIKYRTTRKMLMEFIKLKYRRDDMPLHALNYEFVNGFDLFLKTTLNNKSNTAARSMRRFKTFVIFAQNSGYLHFDPFTNFKIRMKREDRGYLTDEELNLLINKKLEIGRLDRIRDIFVFSCFTGLSYIDVKQLTIDEIVVENGSQWINTSREKSDVRSNILLLEVPLQIIEKYKSQRTDNRVFPVPSNQKVNSYLKEIADVCGIKKNLTFHLARHTFATTVTLSRGVPIETVSRMLGHTNIKTTQIYARVSTHKIQHDMELLSHTISNYKYIHDKIPDTVAKAIS